MLTEDGFRSRPGFTSSWHRMFMFGITTFMFALGIIALVLETILEFQRAKSNYDTSSHLLSYMGNYYIPDGALW
jgi:hypothetical protein